MENVCDWTNCKKSENLRLRKKKIIVKTINGYVKSTLNYLITIGIILRECLKMKLKIL